MPATLYYTPTSCGAASYISAHKGGLIASGAVVPVEVDIRSHEVKTGADTGKSFYEFNPKGNVPALVLEDGTLLNEGAAVLQWIADQAGAEAGLAPANGTTGRYVLQNKLNYVATEVHVSSFGPLFNPALSADARAGAVERLKGKLTWLSEKELEGGKKPFLLGAEAGFTVADAYLYIVLTWSPYVGLNLSDFPVLEAYKNSIAALPFVQEAHAAMAAASPK